jgi:cell division inhibitor SepF
MAASFMKKTMAYLGLVDDDYDDYEDYDTRSSPAVGRVGQRVPSPDDLEEPTVAVQSPRIRTISPTESGNGGGSMAAGTVANRPGTASVRPLAPDRVHIVAPARFGDAQEIANRLMNNQPVIVNMQNAERDLQRRMIDFCSGVTYALSGGMERVADEVFLLTPSNVKVSDEERQRLADRGLVSH